MRILLKMGLSNQVLSIYVAEGTGADARAYLDTIRD